MKTGNPVVDQISEIQIQGNIVPTMWLKNITFTNKKPHLVAIMILAEIFYWYRMTVIRDENGQIVEVKKKFKADKLQRSYQSFADQFGFTKRQVKEAVQYLVERGLINREFRHITTKTGIKIPNVMFVEPVPEQIKKITYEEVDLEVISDQSETLQLVEEEAQGEMDNSKSRQQQENMLEEPIHNHSEHTEPLLKPNQENEEAMKHTISEKSSKHPVPIQFYEQNHFQKMNPFIAERIHYWCGQTSDELVLEAMELAVEYGGKTWRYIETILKNWVNQGLLSVKAVRAFQNKMKGEKRHFDTFFARKEMVPVWLQERQAEQDNRTMTDDERTDFEALKKDVEARMKKYKKRGANKENTSPLNIIMNGTCGRNTQTLCLNS